MSDKGSTSGAPLVFYTNTEHFRPDCLALLNAADRQQASQQRHPQHHQRFVLGRALLAYGLSQLTGCTNYVLQYQELGKPYLPEDFGVSFNLSHSAKHIILALTRETAIGIDIEALRQRRFSTLAKAYFPEDIQKRIQQADEPAATFYRYWTQYEARVKYQGGSVFQTSTDETKVSLPPCFSYRFNDFIFSVCATQAPKKLIVTDFLTPTTHQLLRIN